MTNETKPKRNEPVAAFVSEPVVEGVEATPRPDWALTEKRLPLFEYDDDAGVRQTVTMPDKPNPGLALDFLRNARRMGGEVAIAWIIEEAIGTEGFDILVEKLKEMPDPENGAAVMRSIGEKVQIVVMGGLDGPKA